MPTPKTLGETIATSTSELLVQSADLNQAPALGAVVSVDGLLGVVTESATGPIDSGRRTVALGLDGGDVHADHPELPSLLRSTFRVRPVADKDGRAPRSAALLHQAVSPASEAEIRVLNRDFHHLHFLADLPATVIAAHVAALTEEHAEQTKTAARALVRELAGDADKLRICLALMEPT